MHVEAGGALLEAALQTGAPSLIVVGTGKNIGKTVAMRAIYRAALARGMAPALTSIGRDGEAIDAGDAQSKPRLYLRSGTVLATARDVLPVSPASEILDLSSLPTAAGALVYARVRTDAYYELVGPPTASGLRESIETLLHHAPYAIVDGAIDRIAALAGGNDAVVVACGAAASATMEEAVSDVRALVARLCVACVDRSRESVRLTGALTPSIAAQFIRERETRQIVVQDPTQIALTGRAALHAFERLQLRCERAIKVVAVTVASIGRDRSFEPRTFAHEVAAATRLPTFDVYAAERAA